MKQKNWNILGNLDGGSIQKLNLINQNKKV